jgi:putative PIN family toxin of toxin-antitoxin system
MKAVFDTNIFLAAFFNRGFVFDLLQYITKKSDFISLYTSYELKGELVEKLLKYQKQNIISKNIVEEALIFFGGQTHMVRTKETIKAITRDLDDNRVLECAVAAQADIIVTLDQDLLNLKKFRSIAIIHPKTLYYMLPGED